MSTMTTIPSSLEAGTSTASRVLRYAAMPVFLGAVLVGLYLWLGSHQLDSVELRTLNWNSVLARLREHVVLTGVSTAFVLALAVPLGIVATRPGRERFAVAIIGLGNTGQAIPALGMLGLLFFLFNEISFLPSTGPVPAIVVLTAYSFLPILRNTMVGLQQVPDAVLEAGTGMGMSRTRVLRKIELPLAVPVILAGVRTALVLNVGTAALAFLVGAGGLGQIIVRGYSLQRLPVMVTGAVLTACLALFVDWVAGIAEEQLAPAGL